MNLNRFATGQAQPGLSVETIERLQTKFPHPAEQQKIAAFLSALDRRIETTAQQLAGWKKWKRGLMQGLFAK
ncbi:MAG: restriction endonuclease subunit S [Rhodospirillales bacterium]|nr:restriction endonuclease subunit S [Rhodospirillales bacterium]